MGKQQTNSHQTISDTRTDQNQCVRWRTPRHYALTGQNSERFDALDVAFECPVSQVEEKVALSASINRVACSPMDTCFVKINDGSNAELNAPASTASQSDEGVIFEFALDAFRYNKVAEGDRGRLIFRRCWRYRLGSTNDEGAGISANVDSARSRLSTVSFMKFRVISNWNPRPSIGP